MNEKIPPQLVEFIAPLWVWVLSCIGAIVGYLEDFRAEDKWPTRLLKFVTRASSSVLAGLLTYSTLKALKMPEEWHIPLVAIAGHMGTEALKAFGEFWKSKVAK